MWVIVVEIGAIVDLCGWQLAHLLLWVWVCLQQRVRLGLLLGLKGAGGVQRVK